MTFRSVYVILYKVKEKTAGVMELADVPDSKSGGSDTVRVRPPPPAPLRRVGLLRIHLRIHCGIFGVLAQLGERYTGSVEVSGSIPLYSTTTNSGRRRERLKSDEYEDLRGKTFVFPRVPLAQSAALLPQIFKVISYCLKKV